MKSDQDSWQFLPQSPAPKLHALLAAELELWMKNRYIWRSAMLGKPTAQALCL